MTNLYIPIIITAIILGGIRFILWRIDYYYDEEEGYELECEQNEYIENENPRTGGNQ